MIFYFFEVISKLSLAKYAKTAKMLFFYKPHKSLSLRSPWQSLGLCETILPNIGIKIKLDFCNLLCCIFLLFLYKTAKNRNNALRIWHGVVAATKPDDTDIKTD